MTREQLAKSSTSLALPDDVGKEKDSVAVAEVLEVGPDLIKLDTRDRAPVSIAEHRELHIAGTIQPGDLVAYIPYTDAIIMDGFEKRNLIAYKNVMAISKGDGAPSKV